VANFFLVYTHSTSAGLRKFWTCCRTSWKKAQEGQDGAEQNESPEAEDWVGKKQALRCVKREACSWLLLHIYLYGMFFGTKILIWDGFHLLSAE